MDIIATQYPLDLNLPPVTVWMVEDAEGGMGSIFGYLNGDGSVSFVHKQPIQALPDTAVLWCPEYADTPPHEVMLYLHEVMFYLDVPHIT